MKILKNKLLHNNEEEKKVFFSNKIVCLLSLFLLTVSSNATAGRFHIDDVWIRDYLDLAQNKGVFKPGATNIKIKLKNGGYLEFPDLPIPDFSAVANKGPTTSIGGSYVVSAAHNIKPPVQHHAIYKQIYGNTEYTLVDVRNKGDFAVHRLNKYVVESLGYDESVDFSLTADQALERYGVMYQGKKQIIGYRVGSGDTKVVMNGTIHSTNQQYNPSLLAASLFSYKWGGTMGDPRITPFYNLTEGGDSGSGYYLYDNIKKKWVMLGTHLGATYYSSDDGTLNINKYEKDTVDSFKRDYTQVVDLNKSTADISGDKITINNKENSLEKVQAQLPGYQNPQQKDLYFRGGGEIILSKALNMGNGGFIFDENNKYTVKATDGNFDYRGAGLNIGANTIVDWNVKSTWDLHKIGAGQLNVNVSQNNNLKIGNGTVYLNAEKSFNNIYMANNLGTIIINKDNALNNGNEFSNIYFTKGGGTLNLNGYNQKFGKIAATDIGTVITNTSSKKSELNINNNSNYAYHGQVTGNIDLNHKLDQKTTNSNLILDGSIDIKGDVNVKNSDLTMQGHLIAHAKFGSCNLISGFPDRNCFYPGMFENLEHAANDKNNSHYMSNNKISSFDQPDWDERYFKFNNLNLDNAVFTQGMASIIQGNIHATNNSEIILGDENVYRDDNDGENITNGGYGFTQNLEKGQVKGDSYFIGNVNLDKSKLTIKNIFEGSLDSKESTIKFTSNKVILNNVNVDEKSKFTFEKGANVAVTGQLKSEGILDVDNDAIFAITGETNNRHTKSHAIAQFKEVKVTNKGNFEIVNSSHANGNVSIIGDGSQLNVRYDALLTGNINSSEKGIANINSAEFKGNIKAFDEGIVTIGGAAFVDGDINITKNAIVSVEESSFVKSNIEIADGGVLNLGSDYAIAPIYERSMHKEDLHGYTAGLKGNVQNNNGTMNIKHALWIVDGDSKVENLNTKNSLVMAEHNGSFKSLNINNLDSEKTTFHLYTDLVNTDTLVINDVAKGSDNTIIIESDKKFENGKILDLKILTMPKDTDKNIFKVAKKVTGFTELEPVVFEKDHGSNDIHNQSGQDSSNTSDAIPNNDNSDKVDLIVSHIDIHPHTQTIDTANSFMQTSNRNFVVEMNNLHKRMGDLRNTTYDVGAWARLMQGSGDGEYDFNDKYTHVQIGYDKKHRINTADVFTGVTLTYTDTRANSIGFSGSTDSMGIGVYSSAIFDNGLYLDGILKYVKHQNKMDTQFAQMGEVSFDNHSLYLGGELGYKYNFTENTSIIPQAEIVFGHVSGNKITQQNGDKFRILERDSYNPIVGRVGFDVAHKIKFKDSNITARAGINYQFDLKADSSVHLQDENVDVKTDGYKDHRINYVLGVDTNVNDRLRFGIEFNTSTGGKYNVDSEVNANFRYMF